MLTDTVPSGFRYSMLIVAPAMAGLIVAGAPLIGELLPHSFDAGDVETLRVFAALLAPWAVAALLVNLLLPALLALGHGRLVNALAPGLLALHVAATALGGVLLRVRRRRRRRLRRPRGLRRRAPLRRRQGRSLGPGPHPCRRRRPARGLCRRQLRRQPP